MTNNPPSAQIKPGEYGFPLKLKARYDNFIGGEWVAPADGEYYQNLTPVTGQLLCEVASSGKRDIDLALDAAHKVKDKWAHTSVQDRAAILFKIADRMEQNLELLATAETWITANPFAKPVLLMYRWRLTISAISPRVSGHRKAVSVKLIAKPWPIISTNR